MSRKYTFQALFLTVPVMHIKENLKRRRQSINRYISLTFQAKDSALTFFYIVSYSDMIRTKIY